MSGQAEVDRLSRRADEGIEFEVPGGTPPPLTAEAWALSNGHSAPEGQPLRHALQARPHTWRPLDIVDLGSEPPRPPDLGGLFYTGRRHVLSGEDDSGKTMLLAGISVDELRAGRGVVWVDIDDMGPSMVLERLRALGAGDPTIRSLFAYLRPEEALSDAARDDVVALIRERKARLLVCDAFNGSLVLHGFSPKATEEVEAHWQRVVAPFCRAGAAVVLPDHVVKNKEERGRYAYGSERKATGTDLHLGLRVVEPFGRGRRGRAKITVHRDRIGFLEKPSPGAFVLDSDAATGRLSWCIEPPAQEHGEEGGFRPTRLMEKVSQRLEIAAAPLSRTQLQADVVGRDEYVRMAIDALIADGFAVELEGERRARPVQLLRRFRQANERTV